MFWSMLPKEDRPHPAFVWVGVATFKTCLAVDQELHRIRRSALQAVHVKGTHVDHGVVLFGESAARRR